MHSNQGQYFFNHNNSIKIDYNTIILLKKSEIFNMKSSYFDYTIGIKNTTNEIALLLNIYATLCHIPKDFIDFYNVKYYHINLIRRMGFDFYKDENTTQLNTKKPFGNSNIGGDILIEYNKQININILPNEKEKISNIYDETISIFKNMIKFLDLNSLEYIDKYMNNDLKMWLPTKFGLSEMTRHIRIDKLKTILKYE